MSRSGIVPARRSDQVDDYHGEAVPDPYRWLEDTSSVETTAWIEAQNQLTEEWMSAVGSRSEIGARLEAMWNYPRFGVPFERGGRWFQSRNSGLQDQSVLYVMGAPEDEGRVLRDANLLSSDGTVSVAAKAVSDDGELLAYATSEAGSDSMTWHVRQVADAVDRGDLLHWSKHSTAAWPKDGSGFYYGAVAPPSPGAELLEETGQRTIRFHRLGTPQIEDELVYEAAGEPEWLPDAQVSDDGRYLVITIRKGTAPQAQIKLIDLKCPGRGPLALVSGFSTKANYVTNVGDTFYLITDYRAQRQRMVAVDLADPRRSAWREVIPESELVLVAARQCGGELVCHRLEDACSRMSVFGLDGAHRRDIELEPIVTLDCGDDDFGIEGRPDSPVVHFGLTSFTDSGSLWRYDSTSGSTTVVRSPAAPIDPHDFISEQVFVSASDGASIPVFLTRCRGVERNGDVPVLLYGYGGFDIAITPGFSVTQTVFVQRGGLLAVAVLRGGGEYGRPWHDAGRLANKQRCCRPRCLHTRRQGLVHRTRHPSVSMPAIGR